MENKLIFISGICGSGKSTTAQQINQQLLKNNVHVKWLHEECKNNPIRKTKTNFADSDCKTMEAYFQWSLDIWRAFVAKAEHDAFTYLIDGYIFQSTILRLFDDGFSDEAIARSFQGFCAIIEPLNPMVVSLYRTDLRRSFENVWRQRGNRWKRISIDIPLDLPDEEVDCEAYERDGLLQWDRFQKLNEGLLKNSNLNHIRIDTSDGEWERYYQRIMSALGYGYQPIEMPDLRALANYTGVYVYGETSLQIVINEDAGKLYCEIFFPYMRLMPVSETEFYIRGLSITLKFAQGKDGQMMSFQFIDDYDWSLTNRVYEKEEA